jgi:hypothetical protein
MRNEEVEQTNMAQDRKTTLLEHLLRMPSERTADEL